MFKRYLLDQSIGNSKCRRLDGSCLQFIFRLIESRTRQKKKPIAFAFTIS